MTMTNSPN